MIILMRIDRLLCEMNIGSRSQVKALLKSGQISVNGQIIRKADFKINEIKDEVTFRGKKYRYCPFVYYMMNKPAGVVSATYDKQEKTVLDLFQEQYKLTHQGELAGIPLKDIFPVGRLDKDSVGMLLLTNDGKLAHALLAPDRHVEKEYYVRTDGDLNAEQMLLLESGVDIGEKSRTRPAVLRRLGCREYTIVITEGKFHQVKRMFQAAGHQVIYLKRLSISGIMLDEQLGEGQMRELTAREIEKLKKEASESV